jgi:hypothetical protein
MAPGLRQSDTIAGRPVAGQDQALCQTRDVPKGRDHGCDLTHGDVRMPNQADDDMTIKLTRQATPRTRFGRAPVMMIGLSASLVMAAGTGGWFLWCSASLDSYATHGATLQQAIGPAVTPAEAPPAAAQPAPEIPAVPHDFIIGTGDEQRILDHVPAGPSDGLSVFRFIANPRIFVLDFASLRDQGRMLNRTAALIEKAGAPHDRLLNDAELDAVIRAGGDTIETFYYGHDYGTASLVRFFTLADRDHVHLLNDEETLHRLMLQEGWFEPDAHAALISIPQAGANENVSLSTRATILHHELSHGEYFTNPVYAAFVHHFWADTLTSGERDRVRDRLHVLGYDAALDDVMENEAQAYLMFTDSPKFFTPDMFGLSKTRLADLRNGFFRTMPVGWLRDSLGQTLNINKAAAPAKP